MVTAYDIYNQAKNQVRSYGNAEQAALRQSYQNALGTNNQAMASSGLSGTTIAPSMRMGYANQYQLALNDLGQKLQQQNLSVDSSLGLGAVHSAQTDAQIANQLALGQGALEVSRQNAATNQKQLELQQQQLGYQQANSAYDYTDRINARNQAYSSRVTTPFTYLLGRASQAFQY